MRGAEKTVFVSYRRSVSQHLARSVTLDLRAHGYDVFFDVDTLDNGAFDQTILRQIALRDHFVLVLSSGALERCAEPDDWLRREIEEALATGRNVVPILEAGFSFSAEAKWLPASLRDLPRFNGVPLYHYYFDAAMETLRRRFLRGRAED